MHPVARSRLILRLADATARGRACFVLGGPGSDRLEVAQAAAKQVAENTADDPLHVSVVEFDDDPKRCAEEFAEPVDGPSIRCGGLALHRILAVTELPETLQDAPLQRFPLVPLLRRDLELWAREVGVRMPREDLERAHAATGGHPGLFSAWLLGLRSQPDLDQLEAQILHERSELFAQIDAELAHPELAPTYEWLEANGPSDVARLRRATTVDKPALDRLVLTGVVSRTLGEAANISITCGLYQRHRKASAVA